MKEEVRKHPEWLDMLEKFGELPYDSVISYADLDSCLSDGSVQGDKRYIFSKFKKEMLSQHSKALENVQTVGYRIVNPNEHIRLTHRELKRAERRARTGVDIILHVDTDKLTDKEMAQANLVAARMQNLAATLLSENKSIKSINVSFRLPELPRQ